MSLREGSKSLDRLDWMRAASMRIVQAAQDARAEDALERAPQERRPWLALNAFGYVFLPILGGIVVIAAGLKLALVHYDEPATDSTALLLAGGVALYLAGLVLFRWFLHIGPLWIRLLLTVLTFLTAIVGLRVSAIAQIGLLLAIVVVGITGESFLARRRGFS